MNIPIFLSDLYCNNNFEYQEYSTIVNYLSNIISNKQIEKMQDIY